MDTEKPSTKRCPKCETWKALSDFAKNARSKDGLCSQCKACVNAASRAWNKAHPERVKLNQKRHADSGRRKVWRDKHEAANRERFRLQANARRAANPSLYRASERRRYALAGETLIARRRERARRRYEIDPSKARSAQQAYYKLRPEVWIEARDRRRAAKAGAEGFYTRADIAAIRLAQKDRCAYCRRPLRGRGAVDHIVPLSKGGSNWPRNLQLVCQPCNSRKGTKDQLIYARATGRLL